MKQDLEERTLDLDPPATSWADRLGAGSRPKMVAIWLVVLVVSALLAGFTWEAAAALLSTRTFDVGEALTGALVAGLAVALTRALFFSMKDTE